MREEVLDQCRQRIRLGSKSFSSAARLFDPATRDAVTLLYGWCRYCDDEIDGQDHGHGAAALAPAEARRRLEALVEATRASYRGDPPSSPVFAAFQHVVQRHGIRERYPLDLLQGMEMDVAGHRYATFDELLRYCYHVAGTVGLMMAQVLGARDERAAKHAVDLGIAMQLTNIARDLVEDAHVGRIYLPLDWLAEAGIPAERLAEPEFRPRLAGLARRLLEQARVYYASGDQGLRYLPLRSACAVAAAREVYAAIGTLVLRRGAAAWDRRAVVPRRRKLWLTARGFLRVLGKKLATPTTPLLLPSRIFLQPDETVD